VVKWLNCESSLTKWSDLQSKSFDRKKSGSKYVFCRKTKDYAKIKGFIGKEDNNMDKCNRESRH